MGVKLFLLLLCENFLLVLEGTALLVGLQLTQICLTWLLLLEAAQFVRAAFIARPPPRSSPAPFLTTAAQRLASPQKLFSPLHSTGFTQKHRWLERGRCAESQRKNDYLHRLVCGKGWTAICLFSALLP